MELRGRGIDRASDRHCAKRLDIRSAHPLPSPGSDVEKVGLIRERDDLTSALAEIGRTVR
jgi:hypothetical protein